MVDAPARGRVSYLALLLGFSPALAAATRGMDALVLGGAMLLVLVLSTLIAALIGSLTGRRLHLVAHIAVVAALVTAADVGLRAWMPGLRQELGIYLQLACVGTVTVGRVAIAGRTGDVGRSTADAALLGVGAGLCLFAIACVREALGHGTVTLVRIGRFDGTLVIPGLASHPGAVAVRAAGALLGLGFLLGLVRWIGMRRRAP